jgi:hypothetical protein
MARRALRQLSARQIADVSEGKAAVPQNRPPAGHGLRRFTMGSGPLKRTSDRLECLARILLACILLTGVAVALAVATAVYTQARIEATAQAAARHRVDAQLLEAAAKPTTGNAGMADVEPATAVWPGPSGSERKGIVYVAVGAKVGSTVPIWVDRQGNRTTRPLDDGDVATRALGYAILTYFGISAVAVGGYRWFRSMLDRSRSRRWATEWAIVEPGWRRTIL